MDRHLARRANQQLDDILQPKDIAMPSHSPEAAAAADINYKLSQNVEARIEAKHDRNLLLAMGPVAAVGVVVVGAGFSLPGVLVGLAGAGLIVWAEEMVIQKCQREVREFDDSLAALDEAGRQLNATLPRELVGHAARTAKSRFEQHAVRLPHDQLRAVFDWVDTQLGTLRPDAPTKQSTAVRSGLVAK